MCEYFVHQCGGPGYAVHHGRAGMSLVSAAARVCGSGLLTRYGQGSEERLAGNGCAIIPRPCPSPRNQPLPSSASWGFHNLLKQHHLLGPAVPVCVLRGHFTSMSKHRFCGEETIMYISLHFSPIVPSTCLPPSLFLYTLSFPLGLILQTLVPLTWKLYNSVFPHNCIKLHDVRAIF